MTFEYGIGAKWLEVLKQLITGLKRVAKLIPASLYRLPDPLRSGRYPMGGAFVLGGIRTRSVSVTPTRWSGAIAAFARFPNGGLILVTGSARVSGSIAIWHCACSTAQAARDLLRTLLLLLPVVRFPLAWISSTSFGKPLIIMVSSREVRNPPIFRAGADKIRACHQPHN